MGEVGSGASSVLGDVGVVVVVDGHIHLKVALVVVGRFLVGLGDGLGVAQVVVAAHAFQRHVGDVIAGNVLVGAIGGHAVGRGGRHGRLILAHGPRGDVALFHRVGGGHVVVGPANGRGLTIGVDVHHVIGAFDGVAAAGGQSRGIGHLGIQITTGHIVQKLIGTVVLAQPRTGAVVGRGDVVLDLHHGAVGQLLVGRQVLLVGDVVTGDLEDLVARRHLALSVEALGEGHRHRDVTGVPSGVLHVGDMQVQRVAVLVRLARAARGRVVGELVGELHVVGMVRHHVRRVQNVVRRIGLGEGAHVRVVQDDVGREHVVHEHLGPPGAVGARTAVARHRSRAMVADVGIGHVAVVLVEAHLGSGFGAVLLLVGEVGHQRRLVEVVHVVVARIGVLVAVLALFHGVHVRAQAERARVGVSRGMAAARAVVGEITGAHGVVVVGHEELGIAMGGGARHRESGVHLGTVVGDGVGIAREGDAVHSVIGVAVGLQLVGHLGDDADDHVLGGVQVGGQGGRAALGGTGRRAHAEQQRAGLAVVNGVGIARTDARRRSGGQISMRLRIIKRHFQAIHGRGGLTGFGIGLGDHLVAEHLGRDKRGRLGFGERCLAVEGLRARCGFHDFPADNTLARLHLEAALDEVQGNRGGAVGRGLVADLEGVLQIVAGVQGTVGHLVAVARRVPILVAVGHRVAYGIQIVGEDALHERLAISIGLLRAVGVVEVHLLAAHVGDIHVAQAVLHVVLGRPVARRGSGSRVVVIGPGGEDRLSRGVGGVIGHTGGGVGILRLHVVDVQLMTRALAVEGLVQLILGILDQHLAEGGGRGGIPLAFRGIVGSGGGGREVVHGTVGEDAIIAESVILLGRAGIGRRLGLIIGEVAQAVAGEPLAAVEHRAREAAIGLGRHEGDRDGSDDGLGILGIGRKRPEAAGEGVRLLECLVGVVARAIGTGKRQARGEQGNAGLGVGLGLGGGIGAQVALHVNRHIAVAVSVAHRAPAHFHATVTHEAIPHHLGRLLDAGAIEVAERDGAHREPGVGALVAGAAVLAVQRALGVAVLGAGAGRRVRRAGHVGRGLGDGLGDIEVLHTEDAEVLAALFGEVRVDFRAQGDLADMGGAARSPSIGVVGRAGGIGGVAVAHLVGGPVGRDVVGVVVVDGAHVGHGPGGAGRQVRRRLALIPRLAQCGAHRLVVGRRGVARLRQLQIRCRRLGDQLALRRRASTRNPSRNDTARDHGGVVHGGAGHLAGHFVGAPQAIVVGLQRGVVAVVHAIGVHVRLIRGGVAVLPVVGPGAVLVVVTIVVIVVLLVHLMGRRHLIGRIVGTAHGNRGRARGVGLPICHAVGRVGIVAAVIGTEGAIRLLLVNIGAAHHGEVGALHGTGNTCGHGQRAVGGIAHHTIGIAVVQTRRLGCGVGVAGIGAEVQLVAGDELVVGQIQREGHRARVPIVIGVLGIVEIRIVIVVAVEPDIGVASLVAGEALGRRGRGVGGAAGFGNLVGVERIGGRLVEGGLVGGQHAGRRVGGSEQVAQARGQRTVGHRVQVRVHHGGVAGSVGHRHEVFFNGDRAVRIGVGAEAVGITLFLLGVVGGLVVGRPRRGVQHDGDVVEVLRVVHHRGVAIGIQVTARTGLALELQARGQEAEVLDIAVGIDGRQRVGDLHGVGCRDVAAPRLVVRIAVAGIVRAGGPTIQRVPEALVTAVFHGNRRLAVTGVDIRVVAQLVVVGGIVVAVAVGVGALNRRRLPEALAQEVAGVVSAEAHERLHVAHLALVEGERVGMMIVAVTTGAIALVVAEAHTVEVLVGEAALCLVVAGGDGAGRLRLGRRIAGGRPVGGAAVALDGLVEVGRLALVLAAQDHLGGRRARDGGRRAVEAARHLEGHGVGPVERRALAVGEPGAVIGHLRRAVGVERALVDGHVVDDLVHRGDGSTVLVAEEGVLEGIGLVHAEARLMDDARHTVLLGGARLQQVQAEVLGTARIGLEGAAAGRRLFADGVAGHFHGAAIAEVHRHAVHVGQRLLVDLHIIGVEPEHAGRGGGERLRELHARTRVVGDAAHRVVTDMSRGNIVEVRGRRCVHHSRAELRSRRHGGAHRVLVEGGLRAVVLARAAVRRVVDGVVAVSSLLHERRRLGARGAGRRAHLAEVGQEGTLGLVADGQIRGTLVVGIAPAAGMSAVMRIARTGSVIGEAGVARRRPGRQHLGGARRGVVVRGVSRARTRHGVHRRSRGEERRARSSQGSHEHAGEGLSLSLVLLGLSCHLVLRRGSDRLGAGHGNGDIARAFHRALGGGIGGLDGDDSALELSLAHRIRVVGQRHDIGHVGVRLQGRLGLFGRHGHHGLGNVRSLGKNEIELGASLVAVHHVDADDLARINLLAVLFLLGLVHDGELGEVGSGNERAHFVDRLALAGGQKLAALLGPATLRHGKVDITLARFGALGSFHARDGEHRARLGLVRLFGYLVDDVLEGIVAESKRVVAIESCQHIVAMGAGCDKCLERRSLNHGVGGAIAHGNDEVHELLVVGGLGILLAHGDDLALGVLVVLHVHDLHAVDRLVGEARAHVLNGVVDAIGEIGLETARNDDLHDTLGAFVIIFGRDGIDAHNLALGVNRIIGVLALAALLLAVFVHHGVQHVHLASSQRGASRVEIGRAHHRRDDAVVVDDLFLLAQRKGDLHHLAAALHPAHIGHVIEVLVVARGGRVFGELGAEHQILRHGVAVVGEVLVLRGGRIALAGRVAGIVAIEVAVVAVLFQNGERALNDLALAVSGVLQRQSDERIEHALFLLVGLVRNGLTLVHIGVGRAAHRVEVHLRHEHTRRVGALDGIAVPRRQRVGVGAEGIQVRLGLGGDDGLRFEVGVHVAVDDDVLVVHRAVRARRGLLGHVLPGVKLELGHRGDALVVPDGLRQGEVAAAVGNLLRPVDGGEIVGGLHAGLVDRLHVPAGQTLGALGPQTIGRQRHLGAVGLGIVGRHDHLHRLGVGGTVVHLARRDTPQTQLAHEVRLAGIVLRIALEVGLVDEEAHRMEAGPGAGGRRGARLDARLEAHGEVQRDIVVVDLRVAALRVLQFARAVLGNKPVLHGVQRRVAGDVAQVRPELEGLAIGHRHFSEVLVGVGVQLAEGILIGGVLDIAHADHIAAARDRAVLHVGEDDVVAASGEAHGLLGPRDAARPTAALDVVVVHDELVVVALG